MSRGGRGGSRGGSKNTGPDLSWADDDVPDPSGFRDLSPPRNEPGPLYPDRTYRNIIRTPRPLNKAERGAVDAQLKFREQCRNGPVFSVLDKGLKVVQQDNETNAEERGVTAKDLRDARIAGFDVFNGQDRWSSRAHVVKRRHEPDLGVNGLGDYGYTLRLFPEELWGVLDPTRSNPAWANVSEESIAVRSLGRRRATGTSKKKRKLGEKINFEAADRNANFRGGQLDQDQQSASSDDSDDDPVRGAADRKRRRQEGRRRDDLTTKSLGEKQGLDAEDDYGDEPGEGDEEEVGDEEPEDDEYDEEEDDLVNDDYNAEQYYDGGDGDDDDGEGGGGEYS